MHETPLWLNDAFLDSWKGVFMKHFKKQGNTGTYSSLCRLTKHRDVHLPYNDRVVSEIDENVDFFLAVL